MIWKVTTVLALAGWAATCVEAAWRDRQQRKALEAARRTLNMAYAAVGGTRSSAVAREQIARTATLVGAALSRDWS